MDNIISLIPSTPNTYEFTMKIEGFSFKPEELDVRFVIDCGTIMHSFRCTQDLDKFCVVVPCLPFIEKSMYQFRIEVVTTNGYYFCPFRGSVNIVDPPSVNITGVSNTTVVKQSKPIAPEQPSKDGTSIKTLAQMTQSMLAMAGMKPTIVNDVVESVVEKKAEPVIQSKKKTAAAAVITEAVVPTKKHESGSDLNKKIKQMLRDLQ